MNWLKISISVCHFATQLDSIGRTCSGEEEGETIELISSVSLATINKQMNIALHI